MTDLVHNFIIEYANHWATKRHEWYWYTTKLVCEHVPVTMLQNQGIYSDGKFMKNKPDIIA
jgi:hypothetical protein